VPGAVKDVVCRREEVEVAVSDVAEGVERTLEPHASGA